MKKQLFLVLGLVSLVIDCWSQTEINNQNIIEDFADTSMFFFRYGSTGNKSDFKWKSAVNSTFEPGTKVLSFKIDPSDSAGAGRGPEIISNNLTHFGTYAARLKIPDVKETQPNVGAVVGYFTYHVDTIAGLSEIDFEWLIADPTIIYVGTWTGQRGQLKRIGRTINLAKGIIYHTVYKEGHGGIPVPLAAEQCEPARIEALQGYDASAAFYIYGFDWLPDRIQWWMIHPDTKEKIILWDYKGSTVGIPQNPSHYRMNFWHADKWAVETNPNSIEKPLQPYELEVDWMSYDALKK
jgi:hypothetical protein